MNLFFIPLVLAAATPVLPVTPASRLSVTPQGVSTTVNNPDGTLRSARGHLGHIANPTAATVEGWLRTFSPALGLGPQDVLKPTAQSVDPSGKHHLRFARFRNTFLVELEEIRVHLNAHGDVTSLEAELSNAARWPSLTPRILPARAVELARDGYTGTLLHPTDATLVWLGRLLGDPAPRLAWRVHVAFARRNKVPFVYDVYVDAVTGRVLHKLPRVYTGTPTSMGSTDLYGRAVTLQVTQYSDGVLLQDTATFPSGQILTVDGSNNNNGYVVASTSTPIPDRTGVSVHDNVKRIHDNFASSFGWSNWDFATRPAGSGGNLLGVGHQGTQLNNAFFTTFTNNGQVWGSLNFGDGDGTVFINTARCFDIAAHELGHGVVAGTAGLVYQIQSGALNEHFADVFGWLMDQEDDLIGEDCVGPQLQPALRDMCNPANVAQPQPGNMREFRDLPNTEDGDHGGVHANSGIPNRAACVARNNSSASAVGAVWFQALRNHLGPTSTFQDMVAATAAACGETSQPGGTCGAIANAWVDVGLASATNNGACPANSHAQDGSCFCDEGFLPNSAGNGCDAVTTVQCPANSHAQDGDCYCDVGFVPNDAGTGCVGENSECSANSHREAGTCVCDACYQGNPNGNGQGCVPEPSCAQCDDPLQDGSSGSCQCISGVGQVCSARARDYRVTINGQTVSGSVCCTPGDPCGWANDGTCDCLGDCDFDSADCGGTMPATPACGAAIVGDCGNETWAGRCVGNLLIYCNNQDPANQYVNPLQCDLNNSGRVCGSDAQGGYDCVVAQDNCQGVPSEGQCAGNVARYCDNGVLKEVDCGSVSCQQFEYQGSTLNYCYPCPANAHLNDAQDACLCNVGFVVEADQCVADGTAPTCDGGMGDGGECLENTDCSCSAPPKGGRPLAIMVLLPAVLLLRRRGRRS